MRRMYRVSVMRRVSNDTGHEFDVPQMSVDVAAEGESAALDEARRLAGHALVEHMLQPGNYVTVVELHDSEPADAAALASA